MTAGLRAEIRTRKLPNKTQECHLLHRDVASAERDPEPLKSSSHHHNLFSIFLGLPGARFRKGFPTNTLHVFLVSIPSNMYITSFISLYA